MSALQASNVYYATAACIKPMARDSTCRVYAIATDGMMEWALVMACQHITSVIVGLGQRLPGLNQKVPS